MRLNKIENTLKFIFGDIRKSEDNDYIYLNIFTDSSIYNREYFNKLIKNSETTEEIDIHIPDVIGGFDKPYYVGLDNYDPNLEFITLRIKKDKKWEDIINKDCYLSDELKWSFDCNGKLDFDGSVISISSRFYPPNYDDGSYWKGDVKFLFLGEVIMKRDFKSNDLEELKREVENFTKHYCSVLKNRIHDGFNL